MAFPVEYALPNTCTSHFQSTLNMLVVCNGHVGLNQLHAHGCIVELRSFCMAASSSFRFKSKSYTTNRRKTDTAVREIRGATERNFVISVIDLYAFGV
jgi:hypothetical protein